jgi:hypothetical protein
LFLASALFENRRFWNNRSRFFRAVTRLLFVCSQNRLLGPTAEHIFSGWLGIECASAGTNSDADTPTVSRIDRVG